MLYRLPSSFAVFYIALAAVTLVATVAVFFGSSTRAALRWGYGVCLVLAAAGACWTTFVFMPHISDSVRIHGWPVPSRVLRKTFGSEQWEILAGFGVAAYPANFLMLMLLPSIVALGLVCAGWIKRRKA